MNKKISHVSAGDGTAVKAALYDHLPGVDDRRLSPLGATGIFKKI